MRADRGRTTRWRVALVRSIDSARDEEQNQRHEPANLSVGVGADIWTKEL